MCYYILSKVCGFVCHSILSFTIYTIYYLFYFVIGHLLFSFLAFGLDCLQTFFSLHFMLFYLYFFCNLLVVMYIFVCFTLYIIFLHFFAYFHLFVFHRAPRSEIQIVIICLYILSMVLFILYYINYIKKEKMQLFAISFGSEKGFVSGLCVACLRFTLYLSIEKAFFPLGIDFYRLLVFSLKQEIE